MISPNVTWLELAWTLVATVGLLLSVSNLREVLSDLYVIRSILPRNGRYSIAKAAVRTEGWRCFQQIGFIAIGVCAMTLSADQNEAPRLVVGAILLTLGVGSTIMSLQDALLRRRLLERHRMPAVDTGPHALPAESRRSTDKDEGSP